MVVDPLANLSPRRGENDASEMLNTLLPRQRLTARGVAAIRELVEEVFVEVGLPSLLPAGYNNKSKPPRNLLRPMIAPRDYLS